MEDTALDEGGENSETIQTRGRDDGDGSGDGGADAEQGVIPPAASAASDTKFSIDDDDVSISNDEVEDLPPDEEDIGKSVVDNIPSEKADMGKSVDDKKMAATEVPGPKPSSARTQSGTNKRLVDDAAIKESSDANEKPSSSPRRLQKMKIPNARSPKSPASQSSPTPHNSMPQSRRSPKEPENDESDFGPFEDSEWNPFGGEDIPGDMFHVDDDIQDKSNNNNGAYERKASTSLTQTAEAELDSLRRVFDSEYERALEDQEISWRARYGATRLSFIMSALLMLVYLWLGCMFYRSEAGWSVPDALLFTVYTVTTVGYGGPQPLPNTAAFHAFTSVYVIVGISLVTVLAAHTYQLITLEATRMRSSPWGRRQQSQEGQSASNDFGQEALTREMDKYKQQFMNELEDLVREQPLLDAAIAKFKEIQLYMRTTKSGRVLSVVLPFLGMIFLGAIVVGTIEEWSPLESIYWSIVTLTTVGYGDYTPTKKSSVWFCTLFFIPSSLFFLSFLLTHVAKSYIRLHAIHVARLERKMRRKNERCRTEVERADKAKQKSDATTSTNANPSLEEQSAPPDSPGGSAKSEDMEKGFTTIISYTEDEDSDNSPTNRGGLFGEQAGNFEDNRSNDPLSSESLPALRYRENVIRNKDAAPDPRGNRAVTFAEALLSLNRQSQPSSAQLDQSATEPQGTAKPSLDVRLRVQARLARIIAEEVAGYQTGVVIKGSTVSLTVGSLRDTVDKWKIPLHAWKAFRAVAFRSLLFVGERELISDGGDALLRLNVVEFHQIFSPMLAAMGDGSSMEAWLAVTDILADVELRGGARYGRGKPIFNGTFT
mmetsp:Transcript_3677/g.8150  ORF Transcript_3677/g.8150 Transcript_3677/m.8150 type:complete len:828 (-) Transcript_3677:152-2635(-)